MRRFSDGLARYARGWIIMVAWVVTALFPIVLFPLAGAPSAALQAEAIDLHFSYTPQNVYQILAELSEQGLQASVRMHLTVDILYPIAYALAFGLLITYFSRRLFQPQSWLQRLNLLPFAALLADFAENIGVVLLIRAYPEQLTGLARLTSLATSSKWLLVSAMTIWVIVGLIWLALDRFLFKRRRGSS